MDEVQLVKTERIVASGIFTKSPCLIYCISGLGVTEATNVFTVYNGTNTSGENKFRLACIAYSSDFRLFASPLFFPKGLYVEFTTNGTEVFAQYMDVGR